MQDFHGLPLGIFINSFSQHRWSFTEVDAVVGSVLRCPCPFAVCVRKTSSGLIHVPKKGATVNMAARSPVHQSLPKTSGQHSTFGGVPSVFDFFDSLIKQQGSDWSMPRCTSTLGGPAHHCNSEILQRSPGHVGCRGMWQESWRWWSCLLAEGDLNTRARQQQRAVRGWEAGSRWAAGTHLHSNCCTLYHDTLWALLHTHTHTHWVNDADNSALTY